MTQENYQLTKKLTKTNMPTLPPKSQRVLPPEGTHIGRCVGFIHVGTYDDEYQGQPITSNKIRLTFELPDELHIFKEGDDAKPFTISQEYTLAMSSKANLRKLVEGIVGALHDEDAFSFDTEQLVGKCCLLTIKHRETAKGNKYAVIATASPLMKGQVCKEAFNPSKILNYTDHWDEDYFNSLPDFIREKMVTTQEYKNMTGQTSEVNTEVNTNDVPF
jgi:hypothetical protein